MMDEQRIKRALIGFVFGILIGLGINYLFLLIFNKMSIWIGRQPVQITWASGIPLAVIFGLSLAINMANPPFGD